MHAHSTISTRAGSTLGAGASTKQDPYPPSPYNPATSPPPRRTSASSASRAAVTASTTASTSTAASASTSTSTVVSASSSTPPASTDDSVSAHIFLSAAARATATTNMAPPHASVATGAVPPCSPPSGAMRKELDMRLTAYLPAVVRRHLELQGTTTDTATDTEMDATATAQTTANVNMTAKTNARIPETHEITAVSMFADVSGFTAMTESLAARGPVGAEFLGRHLNSYFEQLLRLVSSAGGDVFKFAGDAMLIFWPESKEDTLETLLRRCVQCALKIQMHLHRAELAPGVVLSVKMGIGIGGATIAHLGGMSDGSTARAEYIAVGPALEQAFASEHQAEAGQVICSPESWAMIGKFCEGEPVRIGCAFQKVTQVVRPIKLMSRRPSFTRDDPQLHHRMKQYVSRAVWPYLDAHDEFWGSELRDVTVLFINLGFSEEDLACMLDKKGLLRLQDAFACVQKCIYEYEGTINKFLVDDKGSTVIAAFGLPPVTHEDDPIRSILSSLAICAQLGQIGLKASVGITTGVALCGVVGHQGNRREYTVLGDIVNLSARLMQKAKSERGGVITDETTMMYSRDVLHFEERPEIMVKGKNDSIKIHRPYPRMSILLEYHLSSAHSSTAISAGASTRGLSSSNTHAKGFAKKKTGAIRTTPISNVMENMHLVQVREAQRRLSRRAEMEAADTRCIVESEAALKIRDELLQTCSRLTRFASGGSFVLEGDIGVGKTVILRNALASLDPGSYNVCLGTASPYATRTPYGVWAEILTKCALENYGDLSASSTFLLPNATLENGGVFGALSATPSGSESSREGERRQRVAEFVLRKIREGAAPNTTLVGYAHLLNNILETRFEEVDDGENRFPEQRGTIGGKTISLLDTDLKSEAASAAIDVAVLESGTPRNPNENNNQEEEAETDVTSPAMMHVKEEDIAAWFLGLLEMDLASRRDSDVSIDRESFDSLPHCESKSTSVPLPHQTATGESSESTEGFQNEWKPKDLDLSGILLLCALHAISRDRATVFCLDSAMFMDEKSWVLTTIIAKYFTNCVVVLATRPPSLAMSEHTQSTSFLARLRLLKRMRPCVAATMEPLSATEVHQLALQILKVQVIPSELVSILISRSLGNPLFLREIISEMLQQQVIKLDETRYRCYLQVQEPDGDKSMAPFCFHCFTKFANNKEKHRCKSCRYVFCTPCTPDACRKKLPGSTGDAVRHCCNCYTLSSTRRRSSDRTETAVATTVSPNGFSSAARRHKSRMKSIFSPESNSPPVQPSLKNRVALRPPKTVRSVLTTMLDQLTVSQRMLMKTASAIGSVCEEGLLRNASPIAAHLGRFHKDLAELERLAMIRRLDTFVAGVPTSKASPYDASSGNNSTASSSDLFNKPAQPSFKTKYEFCHGFMQDVIRSQMLCSQLDKLNARIADCREQHHKELRQRFFEKANSSLNRPIQVVLPALGGAPSASATRQTQRRGSNPHNQFLSLDGSNGRRRSLTTITDLERSALSHFSADETSQSGTSASHWSKEDESSVTEADSPQRAQIVKSIPTFMRLKAGNVFVKKHSSVFSHFKVGTLTNARLWKKRYAVLLNERLLLQYDETNGTRSHQATVLFLNGAKVSACDPDVATKVNCFQIEVRQWTKGKYMKDEKRFFVVGVQSEAEVENWVFMIRYAVESLENQVA